MTTQVTETSKITIYEGLRRRGVSRRSFLKLCSYTATLLGLPAGAASAIAQTLQTTPRPSVIWLSFQECTGCTESLTRSFNPAIEDLILSQISLDYHHTLQAAAGHAAEDARAQAMAANAGKYVLVVDGSVATFDEGMWSTFGGLSNLATLLEAAEQAALILSIGTCASFGGVAAAQPNPTAAKGVDKVLPAALLPKVINVPGCPPVPDVIGGVIAAYLAGHAIELDGQRRPKLFFGQTVHSACARKSNYSHAYLAETFDDEKARNGACLYLLGCNGTKTRNACASIKWNQGSSYPMLSGHGCMGCAEADFWDRQGGLYGIV